MLIESVDQGKGGRPGINRAVAGQVFGGTIKETQPVAESLAAAGHVELAVKVAGASPP